MSHSPVMQLSMRPVREQDCSQIDGVIAAAFNGNDEVRLVRQLVADNDVVLELVAEAEGAIIGHILFSRLWIEQAHSRLAAVALAPLAVLPDYQRAGVGHALTKEAHRLLVQQGEKLSVVLGDPDYYNRFGYSVAGAAGFKSSYPAQYLQAKCLIDNNPCQAVQGQLIYASAFGDN